MKFISKDLSIKLKEKGFNKPCFGYYREDKDSDILYLCETKGNVYGCLKRFELGCIIHTPTIDQVLEWLREEKHIYISIDVCKGFDDFIFAHEITSVGGKWREDNHYYDSYDDAILAGINFIVEHLI